ncbi:MAG: hypothetical protein U5Q03_18520 [Bacteroidota bacterium]|nr:hypothetical protein [Bacteroidota bacterium]
MKTSTNFLLLMYCLFTCTYVEGQAITTSNTLKNDEISILEEKNKIIYSGLNFLNMQLSMMRERTFVVIRPEGLKKASVVSIPSNHDPSLIEHSSSIRNVKQIFSNLDIEYFRAYRLASGDTLWLEYERETGQYTQVHEDRMEYFTLYHYNIKGIQPGDTVGYAYKYNFPFRENHLKLGNYRVFHHGYYPKENYSLELIVPTDKVKEIFHFKGDEPDTMIIDGNTTYYSWELQQLSGCMDEGGGRPYAQLPHFTFSLVPHDLFYTSDYTIENKYLPYWLFYSINRDQYITKLLLDIRDGILTRQYIKMEDYYEHILEKTPDSNVIAALQLIVEDINDHFTYKDDEAYYTYEDRMRDRMGEHVESKILRDMCRYETYAYFLAKISADFAPAYLCDNRSGEISRQYYYPMNDNDYLFAIKRMNGGHIFIYPKRERYGWYLDELPFYYENTSCVNVASYKFWDVKYTVIPDTMTLARTHVSNKADNTRRVSVMAMIDLQAKRADCIARLSLTGQYSTMTRGVYLHDVKDPGVNPRYHEKIWEVSGQVEDPQLKILKQQKVFPFLTSLEAQYSIPEILSQNGEVFELNIKDWFKHIINKDLQAENRHLDYYPDFLGTDAFVYYIKFDQPVEITEMPENIKINNDIADLEIRASVINETDIQLQTFLGINKRQLPAGDIQQISSIFDRIDELNCSVIKFRLKNE